MVFMIDMVLGMLLIFLGVVAVLSLLIAPTIIQPNKIPFWKWSKFYLLSLLGTIILQFVGWNWMSAAHEAVRNSERVHEYYAIDEVVVDLPSGEATIQVVTGFYGNQSVTPLNNIINGYYQDAAYLRVERPASDVAYGMGVDASRMRWYKVLTAEEYAAEHVE